MSQIMDGSRKGLNRVTRQDQDLRIFNMRRKGLDVSVIGQKLGLTLAEVKAASTRVLSQYAALTEEEIVAEKMLEVSRMELAVKTSNHLIGKFVPYAAGDVPRHIQTEAGTWKEICEPDYNAAGAIKGFLGTIIDASKQKAKLLGLNAPEQQQVAVKSRSEIHVVYENQKIGVGSSDAPIITIEDSTECLPPQQPLLPAAE